MTNIFIGFIFLLFDFTLNIGEATISIIPTFLGYWFIKRGLEELKQESTMLAKMVPWANGMMIATAVTWGMNVFAIELGIVGTILGIVLTVLQIYVTYHVVGGIKEVEEYHQTSIFADDLKRAWVVQIIGQILAGLVVWIPLLGLVAIAVVFAINVYFVITMNKVKSAYIAIPPVVTNHHDTEEI